MGITSAIVLFAVCWSMVFFVVLPLRLKTQGETGEVVKGTHSSAPSDPNLRQKAKITTYWAFGIWLIIATVIFFEVITVRDLDWFNRMSPTSN
jgi:predicted secreted protein